MLASRLHSTTQCRVALQTLRPSTVHTCVTAPLQSSKRVCLASASLTQTSNPAFQYGNFNDSVRIAPERKVGSMTMDGALGKTALLLILAILGASYTWNMFFSGIAACKTQAALMTLNTSLRQTAMTSSIAAIVLAIATIMKPHWADKTAVFYAVFKGAALGSMSAVAEFSYPGLVMSTVMLTMGVTATMLAAFKTRVVEVSDKFRASMGIAIGGVMLTYLATFLLRMAGVPVSFMTSGVSGIAIGCVTSLVAAFTLLLDFDNLEKMEYSGSPRWMEWYGGFSVLVTLLWLYMQLLRLGMMMSRGGNSD